MVYRTNPGNLTDASIFRCRWENEVSQMPRHLISGAHEWINEIPTVPIYYLAKPQPMVMVHHYGQLAVHHFG